MQTRIQLRELQLQDVESIMRWIRDPEVKNNFRFTQKPPSREQIVEFVSKKYLSESKPSELHWALFNKNDLEKNYIGTVSLKKIDYQDQNAELAIVISDKEYRGKGYGQEALYLVCQYGFQMLNLHKIYLTCIAHNTGAIRSYEKFGFSQEGIHKEQIFQGGIFYDEIFMGILKSQFIKNYL